MKVNQRKQNPFDRPNPVRLPMQMYSHKNDSRQGLNMNDLIYRPQTTHCNLNLWSFKQDNSRKFNPYVLKSNNHELTQFEKSLKMSKVTSMPRESSHRRMHQSNHIEDNPFHRKNLLLSRELIENQVESDMNRMNYKYVMSEFESYRGSHRKSNDPDNGTYIENNSFMPITKLKNIDSFGSKSIQESPEGRGSMKEAKEVRPFETNNQKQEITVRGRNFYLEKVYPKQ